jgi:hypothetical protein
MVVIYIAKEMAVVSDNQEMAVVSDIYCLKIKK